MIYQKRNQWCFKNDEGIQHFDTEEAAIKAYGFPMPVAEEVVELEEETEAWHTD